LLQVVPHDALAYTQGLELVSLGAVDTDAIMWESTGLYQGRSSVRLVQVTSGQVVAQYTLPSQYFAEGLTRVPSRNGVTVDRLIQLTWREQTGFVYDPWTLTMLGSFPYSTSTGQGWGIAYRSTNHTLLVTDGSDLLHTWDADTLVEVAPRRTITQILGTEQGMVRVPLAEVNELEWDVYSNTLLGNVYGSDTIVRIDPDSGLVTNVYNLSALYTNRDPKADVLNGIALTNVPGEVWVTGKLWPYMYRIRLVD
jgi:glutaminyl-peptide cyclotransferase